MGIGAVTAAKNSAKYGARNFLQAGSLIGAAGLFWLSFVKETDTYGTGACAPSIFIGLGIGMMFAPITILATSGLDPKLAGLASGLLNCFRQIGASIFLAVSIKYIASYVCMHHICGYINSSWMYSSLVPLLTTL